MGHPLIRASDCHGNRTGFARTTRAMGPDCRQRRFIQGTVMPAVTLQSQVASNAGFRPLSRLR